MDVKSEPKFNEVKVTDLDVAFPGDLQTYTLRDGADTLVPDEAHNALILVFGSGGTVTFNLDHAHWIAQRPRTIRVPVPEPATPKE